MPDGQISLPVGESQDSFVLENGDYYTQEYSPPFSFFPAGLVWDLGQGASVSK